jgi:hypothetical protein
MYLFEIVELGIFGHRIFVERKKVINALGDEGMIIRDIEEKIVIISLDDRGILFITKHHVSFGCQ